LALRYRDPDDVGTSVALLEAVLPDMTEICGLTIERYGVGRAERVRGHHPVRDAVAAYATAAGIAEFELYIGGPDDSRVLALPGSPIAVILGRRIAPPFTDEVRFRLVRVLLLAARGLGVLQEVAPGDAGEIVVCALAAAGLAITGGSARFEARLRPVAKALSRRVRNAIGKSGQQVAGSVDPPGELARGARAALSTARRGALALSGAVSSALSDLRGVDPSDSERRELCLFAVSDALAGIERETGVDRG
jgi:hypothetical protein